MIAKDVADVAVKEVMIERIEKLRLSYYRL